MITLNIDKQTVTVEPGTTILTAAQQMGISIPTMCFVKELKPNSSCLVCLVSVQGQSTLVPACSAFVEEGMSVLTSTPEVVLARKQAVELLLSEHTGDCLAPCQKACPKNINIPLMIRALQEYDFNQALEIIAMVTDPSDASLCDTCKKQCESVCRRKAIDQPVAIADLIRAAQVHATITPTQSETLFDKKRFGSVIRQITPDEINVFYQNASQQPRTSLQNDVQGFTQAQAVQESLRCLHCDCRKQDNCSLRDQADAIQAKQITFSGERTAYTQHVFTEYIYEPGKCIKCGICTKVCEKAGVPAGFTFYHRGFDLKISVPFDQFENTALKSALKECITQCPTGALCWKDK
jgi:predicted molibdopterin-dependent oxidoreductase YjgC